MASILPATLLKNKTEEVASSSLAGKVVGLYFSAHWCPPCRDFTPKLVQWLANFKADADNANKDNFEIVFVSSDKEQSAFDEYFAEMSGFHAVPYENRALKDELSKKFKVRGIPTLVLVDTDGNTITKHGRGMVEEDAKGANFPWIPKPLSEIFGDSFADNQGNKFTRADLAGKYIGIYFSAHWCGPCRKFTPQFVQVYNKLKAQGKPFEVIFASSDKDEASFKEYFGEMPWLTLDADAKQRKADLSRHFEVGGIPTLVMLDPELKTIALDCSSAVGRDSEGAEFPWHPKALNPLNDGSDVGAKPIVWAITDGSDEQVQVAKEALTAAADAEFAKPEPQLAFFYTEDTDESIVAGLSKYLKLSDSDRLVVADLDNNKKYTVADESHTAANINAIVEAFLAGSLPSVPIRS